MQVFVVTANRFGDDESHHYLVGVYTTPVQAQFHADIEESWRGGKYTCVIEECTVDEPAEPDMLDYHYRCKPEVKEA